MYPNKGCDLCTSQIADGELVEKKRIQLPEMLRDVIKCKNPRCITSVETSIPQIFELRDPETRLYRCRYCEAKAPEN